MPITVPAGVEVTIAENNVVTVKGPKGTLVQALRPEMIIEQDGSVIHVKRPSDDKLHCALHGMTRALLHNMVVGVSEGFKKELEVNGVGYRAAKEGNELVMNLGYSHPVKMAEIDGITIDVPAQNKIVISGPDKQKVGQFAAEVREKRPPEPYKGRLNVFRSEKNIYAQVIDDVAGNTLVSASSLDKEIEGNGGNKAAARAVGKLVAERCKAKGIDTVVFDRGGYLYHGRVAELAEGAREGGLQF